MPGGRTEVVMIHETLSQNIKSYRKVKGMTQLQLADALYVAPQTISKWESGISEPDTEKLCAMADIFGVSLDSLVRVPTEPGKKALIAIDGGGTKTDFVLFNESGEILQKLSLGGTNPNAYGLEKAQAVLAEGIDRLLAAGVEIIGLYAGISGASVGENKERLQGFLKDRYPFLKSRVEGDIYNVINSAGEMKKCIGVISGTGSVVYGYDGQMLHRAGGWGYLFDDAGSGFDMGRDLFRYCLACEDGTAEKTELYDRVSQAVGGVIFDHLSIIYAKGKDYIASFTPLIFEYYLKGDQTALKIVEKTVDRLAELITRINHTCDCGNVVVLSGGIASAKDIIKPLLRARIDGGLRIIIPEMPPIFGAAIRCIKLYHGEYDGEAFERNFREMLKKQD